MSTTRDELLRLIQRIHAGTLELEDLKQRRVGTAELEARERALDQLRWQLAAVARRAAHEDLGSAA